MVKFRGKVLIAGLWNLFERANNQIIRFLVNIILARILMPSDYGLVGLIAIFFAISTSFIEGGFLNALIQKQNRSEEDFSTVFYFNIITAVVFYILFFSIAPLVSKFYNVPEITKIMRVLTISIILNSLSIVPRAKLAIDLNFKKQAIAATFAVSISGGVAILLAYNGIGVWALVFQTIISAFLSSLFLMISVRWTPIYNVSFQSFKSLFRFGSKLLVANLLDRVFRNIYLAIIGKFSTMEQLGYYSKAEQFSQIPATNLAGVMQSVTFPRMCEIQDNQDQMRSIYKRNIKIASFTNFPLLLFIAYFSKSIVLVTLTDKWLEVHPYLTLLAIAGLLYPVNFLNMNLLMAMGKSDKYLKLEIIKKGVAIIILVITVSRGVIAIIYGQIVLAVLSLAINSFYSHRLIEFGILKQVKEMSPYFLLALFVVTVAKYLTSPIHGHFTKLLVGSFLVIVLYLSFIYGTRYGKSKLRVDLKSKVLS